MSSVIAVEPELLRHTPLFAEVAAETLAEIAGESELHSYDAGEVLFSEGGYPEYLYILVSGTVQLAATSVDGRETVVELLRPVDAFLMAAVLTGQPYLMSAKTVERSHVLLIPGPLLRAELGADPILALTMLGSMAGQYRRLVRQVKDLRLRTATQRLALYLLQLVESEGVGLAARLPYDKKLLAAHLDMTPESFSRALSALRQYGVDVRGDEVRITHRELLREYCRVDQVLDRFEADLRVMVPVADQ